jgi:hypoxanthine phosphoribosyltransferase
MGSQPKLNMLFTRNEIKAAVKKLAAEIRQDYHDKHPILLGILKGSFVFLADLIRLLDFPLEVEFVRLSGYGRGTETSGEIKLVHRFQSRVRDRHVLVVEDIIDTGLTTAFILEYLGGKKPASLKLCTLTDKPARRRIPVNIDYRGLIVPDKFIVGYGLDWDERFRNLPDMYVMENGE